MVKQSTRFDFYPTAGAFTILLFYILSLFCDALFLFFFVYIMLLDRFNSWFGYQNRKMALMMPL